MISIKSRKRNEKPGNVKAFFEINIVDRITITDIRVVQMPGKRPFVSMPSRSYEGNGQKKWAPIVEITDAKLKQAIDDAVLSSFSQLESEATTKQQAQPVGW